MSKLIEIVDSNRLNSTGELKPYCNENQGRISLCYGFSKDYCPKTCSYAQNQVNQEKKE